MNETRQVHFGITGEFITQITREQFYIEGNEYEKVMEILLSCMCGTDMSEQQLKRYAEDVLLGRAEFMGSTTDGSFHMTTYDAGEEPELPESFNIFKQFSRIKKKLKEKEKELWKMTERYEVALEHMPSYMQREVRKELGETTEEDRQQVQLDSFIKRMIDEEEHTTEDYGWLEPDGKFHEVEWGAHQEWAQNYIEKFYPEQAEDDEVDMQTKCNVGLIGAGDFLVERGWVLLHNPSQGIAIPTKNPLKPYTKAQKEFLYDYFIERGCKDEANEIWKEE